MDELVTPASTRVVSRAKASRLPGEQGVWIFIVFDMCFFGILFLSYVISQSKDVTEFSYAQRSLETNYGLFNTLILLTSSWFVALALQAARKGAGALASKLLVGAAMLGLAFLAVKSLEYTSKFEAGIYLTTNDFFMFYFVITFLHALHVLGGIIVLLVMARKTRDQAAAPSNIKWLECAGIFWHTVDLLWVMIFALFYLISWR